MANYRYHCIRLFRHFFHKQHLCLVFEPLAMNLREILRKYGKHVGINVLAVRAYAHQMLMALKLMRKCHIIHADIKPDNILVDETKSVLKLADFGSAMNVLSDVEVNQVTPYLVSRFYRAPEVMLGNQYDYSIDLWSLAVTLYELCAGTIMFAGHNNNHMLKLMQEYKGKIANKIVRKSHFKNEHFDDMCNFLYHETDKVTQRPKTVVMPVIQPSRNVVTELYGSSDPSDEISISAEQSKKIVQLADFLDKCLALEPSKRMSINDCLRHPFIVEKLS